MKTTRLPPSSCPHCRAPLDAATAVGEPEAVPSPGDWTICLNCGGLLRFDPFLRPAAGRLVDLLAESPEVRATLQRAQKTVRELPE